MDCTYPINAENNITLNGNLYLLGFIKSYSLDSPGYTIFKQLFQQEDNENVDLMLQFEKGTYYYQQCADIDTSPCTWLSWEIISRINIESLCMLKVREGISQQDLAEDPRCDTTFNVINSNGSCEGLESSLPLPNINPYGPNIDNWAPPPSSRPATQPMKKLPCLDPNTIYKQRMKQLGNELNHIRKRVADLEKRVSVQAKTLRFVCQQQIQQL